MHVVQKLLAPGGLLVGLARPAPINRSTDAANPTDPLVSIYGPAKPTTTSPVLSAVSGTPSVTPEALPSTPIQTALGEISTPVGKPRWFPSPLVYSPGPLHKPSGMDLLIGLSVVVGLFLLILVVTVLWNRDARRIGVGNVMGGDRRLLRGNRRQRLRRLVRRPDRRGNENGNGNGNGNGSGDGVGGQGIPLADLNLNRRPADNTGVRHRDWSRRDSDALESMDETSSSDSEMSESGKVSREEVGRQERERW